MVKKNQDDEESGRLHRTETFSVGVRGLLSVAVFATIGWFSGYYLGRFGEESLRRGKGMSTTFGQWFGAAALGSLAAYTSLRSTAQEELRYQETKENAANSARANVPSDDVSPISEVLSTQAKMHGKVLSPSLDKAV